MLQDHRGSRLNSYWTVVKRWISRLRIRLLDLQYAGRPYHEYYSAVMQERMRVNPKYAVGGMWNEIGGLQFEFMRSVGLRPEHRLLDYGCGSLRGGLHFIRYLDPGNYTGVDISAEALRAGRQILGEIGLEDRSPVLVHVAGLQLSELGNRRFDFALAQSVLTHMPPEDIRALFRVIPEFLAPGARFYATIFEGETFQQSMDKLNFTYPFDMLAALAAVQGLGIRREPSYEHPRGQVMISIQPLESSD